MPHRETVHGLARDIDAAIAGFVRGQAVICLILAVFYAIGLTLTGLNFGFLIGLMTGLLSFIPFVGAVTGFLVAAIVAVAQFWPDWTSIAMVAGVFVVGQALEGYVLSPKLVGAKVGLHPVWMMFALIAFGYLFGFVGLLIAIPLAATIGVLLRFALRKYLESPIYTGRGAALSDAGPGRHRDGGPDSEPTQLALALDHAESLAREDFLVRAVQCRGARADRALAGLAVAHRAAARTGGLRQKPSRGDLGAGVGRADAVAARARRRRCAGRARDRRAGAGKSRRGPLRRSRAVSSAQSRARGARLCPHHRAQRAGDLADRGGRSRLAAARAAGGGADARPTTRCFARSWSSCSPTASSRSTRAWCRS